MIPRYARPEAAAIWSPQTRFRIMFEIEAYAADAMAELGVIPALAAKAIWERGGNAIFFVFVSPLVNYDQLRPSFAKMLQSVQFR